MQIKVGPFTGTFWVWVTIIAGIGWIVAGLVCK